MVSATSSILLTSILTVVLGKGPGYVTLPVAKVPSNHTSTNLNIRSAIAAVPEKLSNQVYQYIASFGIGTPGQTQSSAIDTGSSDLWIYSSEVTQAAYSFDSSDSSTYKYLNSDFSILYVDGTSATGDYVTDYITWGDSKVDFEFATVNDYAGIDTTVFGIARDTQYANYPVALKNDGQIQSTAFSLYLDDINADSATILFGGVDTSKYTGPLSTVPITQEDSFNVDFEVYGTKLNGVLDSGTSLTYLPDDVVSQIASTYGAQWDSNGEVYYLDSPYSGTNGVTYSFSGAEVTVPVSELFIEQSGQYILTILPYSQSQGYILLGDTFLRSAYVVYDLDSNQIAVAQADWTPGASNIEVITPSGIPGSQAAPGF